AFGGGFEKGVGGGRSDSRGRRGCQGLGGDERLKPRRPNLPRRRAPGGKWEIDDAYDLVVSVTNVPDTEMTAVRAVKEKGTVIFFGMGTSFQRVALGAEGIGKDANFVIGSGYARGHAELALNLVRENPWLKKWFEGKYG